MYFAGLCLITYILYETTFWYIKYTLVNNILMLAWELWQILAIFLHVFSMTGPYI